MNQKRFILIGLLLFLVVLGTILFIQKRREFSKATGHGSLTVLGQGADLYHVYNPRTGEKINFTSVGRSLTLPTAKYRVELHNSGPVVDVRPGQEIVLEPGTLLVTGSGESLYEVWGESGTNKLDFTSTGKAMMFFPGNYRVLLNGVRLSVNVTASDTVLVETGTLEVPAPQGELYSVFDESGENKLTFTTTGRITELLPGSYVIRLGGEEKKVLIEAGKKSVIR